MSAGSHIQQVNSDGTVACQVAEALPGFVRSTLDSAGSVGEHTSVTIGADGLGLISYWDFTNGNLKVAHSNTACTSASTATLDSAGGVGQYTATTIGADGLGLISYRDFTNGSLKVVHCSNALCQPFVRRR